MSFFRKRLVRIVPLYWLALLWTARRDLMHGTVNIDLIKDFLFIPHWYNSTGEIVPTVVQGWTLNYEMFFYSLFAASLLLTRFRIIVLVACLCALVGLGAFLNSAGLLASTADHSLAGRFYTNDILIEFVYGLILYDIVTKHGLPPWPRTAFLVTAALGFAALMMGSADHFRGISLGLPALLIVWASFRSCEGWLCSRTLALLGNSSYAIYLFHWASFGALKPLSVWVGQPLSGTNVTLLLAAHVLTASLCGIAIHRWIEQPLLLRMRERCLPKDASRFKRQVEQNSSVVMPRKPLA